jgi:hypothetical protein
LRWTAETREVSFRLMRGRLARLTVIHLALAAMMVRALLPAGWMPSASAASFITICTMDGISKIALDANGRPVKHAPAQGDTRHDICPFAAAPHFATTPPALAVSAPSVIVVLAQTPAVFASAHPVARYAAQSPRAPPAIA